MRDDATDRRDVLRWALPASLALHLAAVALLIFGLPLPLSDPQDEEAIKVDLVPPPKPAPKPKPKPPAAAAEKPAAPEKPQPAAPEPKPPSRAAAAKAPEPLKPVYRFGEKDEGPRKASDGNSAEDGAPSRAAPPEVAKPALAQPPPLAAAGAATEIPLPAAPDVPTPRPATPTPAKDAPPKPTDKKLFSRSATGSPAATTAMAEVTRGQRAAKLCTTELRDRLQTASPPYYPYLLPSYPLKAGKKAIDVANGNFRDIHLDWFSLSFHCEVDTEATRVVSFAFRVGGRIPPSEWRQRGIPAD
jgi:hypothetical protein